MPSSSRSSWPRDQIQVSCITGRFFITEPPGKPSDGYIFPLLLCLLLLFFSQLFVRPPLTTVLPFCISLSWGWFGHRLLYNVKNLCLQFVRPSVYWIWSLESICYFHCVIVKDLIYVIPEWPRGFPYFLQFKSEFGNKEFMIWASVSSQSCFCWLYTASPSLAAKNVINLISVLTIYWCPCVESSLALLEEGVCYDQCILLA